MEIINIIITTLAIIAIILFTIDVSLVGKQNKALNILVNEQNKIEQETGGRVYRTDRGGLIFIHDRYSLDLSERIYKISAEEIYITVDGGKTWALVM